MSISEASVQELFSLAQSTNLRKDMELITAQRHNPFINNGQVDIDAYIEFVTQYNEFINHQPKPVKPIIERVMKL